MKPFPLNFPADRPRCRHRETARTSVSLADARDHLRKQLDMLGATHVVISSNAKLRIDGLPYSKQPTVADPGVAVYFRLRGSTMTYCMSCDLNDSISGNLRAVGLSLGELRAIGGRLGVRLSIMLDLFSVPDQPAEPTPAPPQPPIAPRTAVKKQFASKHPIGSWQYVLEIPGAETWAEIYENYLRLNRIHEKNPSQLGQIEKAYGQAKKKFGYK